MEFKRSDRLVELLKVEIAGLLRKVKDPRLSGFLTLTDVALSGDMKSAVVYFSIFGTEEERASSAAALESAQAFLRWRLRERLQIRVIPTLRFEYDVTPERAGRVLEILNKIEEERRPPQADPQPERTAPDPRVRPARPIVRDPGGERIRLRPRARARNPSHEKKPRRKARRP